MILVFDTETTGKADFKSPAAAKHQPHLVQLGAQLIDDDWKVRGEVNLIIKPEGFTIPEEASNIHGITQAIAEKCGVPLFVALSAFEKMGNTVDAFVAHNFDFDALVMCAEFIRETDCIGHMEDARFKAFCTMKAMTPVCQIPGNYGDFKWPKLIEAYRQAFNEDFEDAHDAMADVRACARIYKWLKTEHEVAK